MPKRKYYAERKGVPLDSRISFDMVKRVFLNIYTNLKQEYYFQEALGYYCIDAGEKPGTWGADHEAFVYQELRMGDLWPLEDKIGEYDEIRFFNMVEFLYDHVSAPEDGRYHSFADCGWHGTTWDSEAGRNRYREEVNAILPNYGDGYLLSEEGEVLETAPTGIESLVDNVAQSGDAHNIDNRVQSAISKFRRHNASLDDKKDAIRTLGDILEFLKRSGYSLPRPDDSNLFQIINRFDLRHHNPSQLADYSREDFYPWLFYTTLASIDLLIRIHL